MSAITGLSPPGIRGRLVSHLRVPMFRDGYALVLSAMITAGLGAVYWVIAAHRYSAENVGLNSAAISATTLIAGIAQLNLSSALLRFIPVAGKSTLRLILWSYLTSVLVAGVLSAAFLLVGRRLVPSLDLVDETTALAFMFVGATAIWCVFVLQDAVLTGLRKAVWVPAENAGSSIVKLVLLVAFASAFPRHGIYASWMIGAVATIVPLTVLIVTRLAPHAAAATDRAPSLRELARYIAPDYVGALGWLAAVTVVPLIVIERAGAIENAYFTLAWVVVLPILSISAAMGSSLVASGAVADRRLLPAYLRKMLAQTTLLAVPMVVAVILAAPQLLRIFGGDYSAHATTVVRLLALATLPHTVIALAVSAARVQRRMRAAAGIQVAECAGILVLTWLLLGSRSVNGAGWAWLVAETVVAAGAGLWAIRALQLTDGLVPALGRSRNALLGRWRERTLRPVLHEILERFEATDARLLAAPASDTIVFGSGDVAVKLAHSDAGCRSLSREIEVLRTLASDPRLRGWRRLLPEVRAAGRTAGRVYLVQDLAPGQDGRAFAGRPELLAEAASAIGGLHRLTATERTVGEELLERWVDRPLELLNGAPGAAEARAILYRSLAGRTVSVGWVHGDFVPGNVLVDGTGVGAIVDWDRGTPDGLPLLDHIQFVLACRLLTEHRELGDVVATFRPSAAEAAILAEAALPGDPIDLQAVVLLCWLHHVAANLEKSDRYASSRAWLQANVKAVLDEL